MKDMRCCAKIIGSILGDGIWDGIVSSEYTKVLWTGATVTGQSTLRMNRGCERERDMVRDGR